MTSCENQQYNDNDNDNKQLLDNVFVISGIIKVTGVSVVIRGRYIVSRPSRSIHFFDVPEAYCLRLEPLTRNALAVRNYEEEGLGKDLLKHSRILNNIAASSETFGGKHFHYMTPDEIKIMF